MSSCMGVLMSASNVQMKSRFNSIYILAGLMVPFELKSFTFSESYSFARSFRLLLVARFGETVANKLIKSALLSTYNGRAL